MKVIRYAIAACALALAACTAAPVIQDNAVVGPVVEGKKSGSTTLQYLPFSNSAGDPVIATEAWVGGLYGTPQVVDAANVAPTTLKDWDYYILNGTTGFTLPKISTVKAAGALDGFHFLVHSWKGGVTTTVGYPDSCYMQTGACPTLLEPGDLVMYQMNGTIWRAIRLASAPKPTPALRHFSKSAPIVTLSDGDHIVVDATDSVQLDMASFSTLGFSDGQRFTIRSFTPTGKTVTLTFQENVYTGGNGVFANTKALVLQPGDQRTLVWSQGGNWFQF